MKFELEFSGGRKIVRDYDSWEEATRFGRSHCNDGEELIAVRLIGIYTVTLKYSDINERMESKGEKNCI